MAKLVKCKTCGKEVSETAWKCPHCGEKNPGISTLKSFLSVLVVIFIIAIIVSFNNQDKKDDKPTYKERVITQKELKNKWPLTVDKAIIRCYKDESEEAPVVIIEGYPFGLTGWADIQYGQKNTKALNRYWKKDTSNNLGLYIDLSTLTDEALKLCKE